LAVLGNFKGLQGKKNFLKRFQIFFPRRRELSPKGCLEGHEVANKASAREPLREANDNDNMNPDSQKENSTDCVYIKISL
jgi:hypothetical protein